MNLLNISLKRDLLTGLWTWPRGVELAFPPSPYSIIFGDFDHMKKLMDTHGIPAGDAALATIASVLHGLNWPHLMFFRFAGDEFLILARDYSLERAELLVGDINRQVREREIEVDYLPAPLREVSLTWGIAVGGTSSKVEELVLCAQEQVCIAKKEGRRGSINSLPIDSK